TRFPGPQVREDHGVLGEMVMGDHPAVALAVGAHRPVVLPHGHLVELRPRLAGADQPVPHLGDEIAQAGQFRAQHVVYLDQVPAGRPPGPGVRRPGRGTGPPRPGGLVPHPRAAEPGAVVLGGLDAERLGGCFAHRSSVDHLRRAAAGPGRPRRSGDGQLPGSWPRVSSTSRDEPSRTTAAVTCCPGRMPASAWASASPVGVSVEPSERMTSPARSPARSAAPPAVTATMPTPAGVPSALVVVVIWAPIAARCESVTCP